MFPIHARTRLHARHAHVRTRNAAATKIRSFARQGYLASGGFKGSRLNVITIIKLSEREWTLGYKYLSFLKSCVCMYVCCVYCVCVCVCVAACTIGCINGTVRPYFQGCLMTRDSSILLDSGEREAIELYNQLRKKACWILQINLFVECKLIGLYIGDRGDCGFQFEIRTRPIRVKRTNCKITITRLVEYEPAILQSFVLNA